MILQAFENVLASSKAVKRGQWHVFRLSYLKGEGGGGWGGGGLIHKIFFQILENCSTLSQTYFNWFSTFVEDLPVATLK